MSDLIKEKITRWSLERVQFLLSHIESFVDDDTTEVRERARSFVAQSGLDKIESLVSANPGDPALPLLVLQNLSPFFESGLLLQRGLDVDTSNWYVTDLFWRGNTFHLELKDQVCAKGLVPEITPLQVHRATAGRVLSTIKMDFLMPTPEAQAYLFRPTPSTAYVCFSALADHWAADHVAGAHKLVNKAFIY